MRHTSGYTLIEILVALAIIATAVAAVVAGVSGYVNNAAYLRDRTVAQWVVSNKIAEMQLATEWPSPGKRRGEALMADHEWSWQVNVSTTDDPDVLRLDVSAYPDKRSQTALADAVAYLSRPAPVTPGVTPCRYAAARPGSPCSNSSSRSPSSRCSRPLPIRRSRWCWRRAASLSASPRASPPCRWPSPCSSVISNKAWIAACAMNSATPRRR